MDAQGTSTGAWCISWTVDSSMSRCVHPLPNHYQFFYQGVEFVLKRQAKSLLTCPWSYWSQALPIC